MKKEELEKLLDEMKEEMDELIEMEETDEVVIRYNTIRKYYIRLKFIIRGV